MAHTKRYSEKIERYSSPKEISKKVNTRSEAIAWGRLAAKLEWGIGGLDEDVTLEFHEVAKKAYSDRLMQLTGHPF